MLETEFLFFQGMKKRIDQRISEGNYDEAAVSMQKCMEYILNSLEIVLMVETMIIRKFVYCLKFRQGLWKIILNTLFIGMNGKQSLNIVISRCICKENRLI